MIKSIDATISTVSFQPYPRQLALSPLTTFISPSFKLKLESDNRSLKYFVLFKEKHKREESS